jgi:hypothetical protein
MFRPQGFKTLVHGVPDVRIPASVLQDMWTITDSVNTEVGWLVTAHMVTEKTATSEERYIVLDEVLIPSQEVHATTTEFTPDGMGALADRLIREDGAAKLPPDQWRVNKIRSWFHSHVRMDTSPSGQDEVQAYEFGRKFELPWMLRGIVNKNGKMTLDLFWFEYGFVIRDIAWDVVYDLDDARTARLKEDIAKLVRPFRSTVSYNYQTPQQALIDQHRAHYRPQDGYTYGD